MSTNNKKCEILFFYSASKYESIAAKLILNNYLISNSVSRKYNLKEIDFDKNIELCKKYNVTGVPTTLLYCNNELHARHLGEFTFNELNILLTKTIKFDKNQNKK
jgi:hypothetical protein